MKFFCLNFHKFQIRFVILYSNGFYGRLHSVAGRKIIQKKTKKKKIQNKKIRSTYDFQDDVSVVYVCIHTGVATNPKIYLKKNRKTQGSRIFVCVKKIILYFGRKKKTTTTNIK